MDRLPRPPESFLQGTPPYVRASIEQLHALIDHLYSVIEKHEIRIADLEARLNMSSANSSLPPSALHPHAKPIPGKPKSSMNRGGQGTNAFEWLTDAVRAKLDGRSASGLLAAAS